jgi:hypothetical protein
MIFNEYLEVIQSAQRVMLSILKFEKYIPLRYFIIFDVVMSHN